MSGRRTALQVARGALEAAAELGSHLRPLGTDTSMVRSFAARITGCFEASPTGKAPDDGAGLLAQLRD